MNMKKIGVSALAGSLAMVSANAAELSVAGKTELTYTTKPGDVTGNPFGFGNSIAFNGSGDVNGMTASYFAAIKDGGAAGFASSNLTLDMGEMGMVGFDQGVGTFGVSTIDDKMPYAYEEVWSNTGGSAGLRAAGGSTNVLGYKGTFSGVTINAEMNPGTKTAAANTGDGGTSGDGYSKTGNNVAITADGAMLGVDGLSLGAGYGEEKDTQTGTHSQDDEFLTAFATYAIGAATVGAQVSEGNGGSTGASGNSVEMYGISFSVNENLAVSYNEVNNTYNKASATDVEEENRGFGASYTMGSASVRVLANETDNVGGTQASNKEAIELSLMLAF